MSKATKRKHVEKEVLDEFVLPDGLQQIVRVVGGRGNNLHEVETDKDERFLVSMPTKFRKNVWIKRGDYVIVMPIEEGEKVRAEIEYILYKDQIKYIKDEGKWPEAFCDSAKNQNGDGVIPDDMLPPCDSDSDQDDLADMVVNTNRRTNNYVETDSEEEESDAEEDGEG